MSWDWSTAGKMKDGKPFTAKDSAGKNSYDSKKGDFTWEKDVIPEYVWFNGAVDYTLRETKLDPSKVLKINTFDGSPNDGKSMIWPMKVFRGKQPYDAVSNQLVIFHTYGKDDSAYWGNFDWDKAVTVRHERSWTRPTAANMPSLKPRWHGPLRTWSHPRVMR